MKTPAKTLTVLAAAAAFVSPAIAEITLVDSVGFGNTTGSTEDGDGNDATRTVGAGELGDFDANGVDKLVVVIGGEGEGNGTGNNTVTGVTYGGVAMSLVVDKYGTGNRGTSMWYLDDVSASGDFVITFTENQSGLGFGAYALDGTVAGTAATTASTTSTTGTETHIAQMTLTTTVPGEFVIASFARNNVSDPFEVVAPLTQLYLSTTTDGSSAASGYQWVSSPATILPQIVNLTNGVGGLIAASFQPLEPPSPETPLTLADFSYDATTGDAEVSIVGSANTAYILVEADDLDFSNPDQNPIPLTGATVGTLDGNVVTTDGSGNATVQFDLGTAKPATFIRAESAP